MMPRSGRKGFVGVLLALFLVGYSSLNWLGSIFSSSNIPTQDGSDRPHQLLHDYNNSLNRYYDASAAVSASQHTATKQADTAYSDGRPNTMNAHDVQMKNKTLKSVDINSKDINGMNSSRSEDSLYQYNTTDMKMNISSSAESLHQNQAQNETLYMNLSATDAGTAGNVSKQSTYIPLPLPKKSLPPVSFTGCCGIGHRLSRNLPTMVYAISNSRLLHANWADVKWSVLFNDTAQIIEGPSASSENYGNEPPVNWHNSSLAYMGTMDEVWSEGQITEFDRYGETVHMLCRMPLAHSIVKLLADNLSPLVLSFLQPLREQYAKSDLHLCTHIREGNNETGDWQRKKWRHIDLQSTLNQTLTYMEKLAKTRKNATKVSVFVASDTTKSRTYFEENAPPNWHIVKPAKELSRPETGIWFGEATSTTNEVLSQEEKNEAMAEAVSDVFALGECDALFIPNYSSFSAVGMMLARAKRRQVFFRGWNAFFEYQAATEG